MSFRKLTQIFGIFTLAFLLVACGGGEEAPETTEETETQTETTAETNSAEGDEIIVGLITKTETNPFFVKMKEGAQAKADELGATLMTAAGSFDGDNEAQVTAIENMVAAGASGILITANDTSAIVPTIEEARAALEHGTEAVLHRAGWRLIEVICTDDNLETVVDTILQTAQTGQIGDGKIFVSSIESVVRIRTGEVDESAI